MAAQLASCFTLYEPPAGTVLYSKGDAPNCAYLIIHGAIDIIANQSGIRQPCPHEDGEEEPYRAQDTRSWVDAPAEEALGDANPGMLQPDTHIQDWWSQPTPHDDQEEGGTGNSGDDVGPVAD